MRFAHELNNLLTTILGYAELVLASLDPNDPRHADVSEIQKAGVRAAELTRQLLAVTRPQIIEPTRYGPVAEAAQMVVEPSPAPRPRAGSETILVVEDAEDLRQLTSRLLRRLGYAVLSAANGEEALELFERNASIDLVLTDVVMPGGSGPELTRQLVERRPWLKVLYMSGYTEDIIMDHGVRKPGIAFLYKPFTSDALGQKIRELFDR